MNEFWATIEKFNLYILPIDLLIKTFYARKGNCLYLKAIYRIWHNLKWTVFSKISVCSICKLECCISALFQLLSLLSFLFLRLLIIRLPNWTWANVIASSKVPIVAPCLEIFIKGINEIVSKYQILKDNLAVLAFVLLYCLKDLLWIVLLSFQYVIAKLLQSIS